MEEFSQARYKVDVLKVEVPVNAEYVEGSSVFKGQKAYSHEEALRISAKPRRWPRSHSSISARE